LPSGGEGGLARDGRRIERRIDDLATPAEVAKRGAHLLASRAERRLVTAEPASALAHDVLFAACLLVVIGGLALDANLCDVRLVERDGVCIVSAERFGQYWSAPALHL
jgi:hypothetical protein